MGFNLPKLIEEKRKEAFEKRYFYHNDKKVHVTDFEDQSISSEMKNEMRMNSYASDDIPPKLTTKALLDMAKYYQSQCSEPIFPCSTYNEALIHKIVPELIKRLENK